MSRATFLLPLITLSAIAPVNAQTSVDLTPEPQQESPWSFGIAIGYGERTNPLIYADDIRLAVDVDIAWFGDRWFFDNGDGGFTFRDRDRYTLSAVGRINSDRVFFSKTNVDGISVGLSGLPGEIEVPDRDYAIEAGIELLTDGRWGYLQATAFRDVSGTHDGYEIFATFGHVFRKQRWSIEPSIGASFKSRRLNDYYWGISPDEVSVLFDRYSAASGTNTHARLGLAYRINRQWSFVAVSEYERLSSTVAESPLVAAGEVRGLYAGFGYRF
ncbi:MAG: MipA/OmpV family protein [Gammaproteobacteria bacterium]|nr:MipA/OmpV family protein [Gammaproteobacteria bacterium]